MLTFLLVVQALVAAALVAVILMQQSEGGGLGMGGSPTGLMSARGAANFLTRATAILAGVFVLLCIAMAVIASQRAAPGTIDTSLKGASPITAPTPGPKTAPASGGGTTSPVPLGGEVAPAGPVPTNGAAPAAQ